MSVLSAIFAETLTNKAAVLAIPRTEFIQLQMDIAKMAGGYVEVQPDGVVKINGTLIKPQDNGPDGVVKLNGTLIKPQDNGHSSSGFNTWGRNGWKNTTATHDDKVDSLKGAAARDYYTREAMKAWAGVDTDAEDRQTRFDEKIERIRRALRK